MRASTNARYEDGSAVWSSTHERLEGGHEAVETVGKATGAACWTWPRPATRRPCHPWPRRSLRARRRSICASERTRPTLAAARCQASPARSATLPESDSSPLIEPVAETIFHASPALATPSVTSPPPLRGQAADGLRSVIAWRIAVGQLVVGHDRQAVEGGEAIQRAVGRQPGTRGVRRIGAADRRAEGAARPHERGGSAELVERRLRLQVGDVGALGLGGRQAARPDVEVGLASRVALDIGVRRRRRGPRQQAGQGTDQHGASLNAHEYPLPRDL